MFMKRSFGLVHTGESAVTKVIRQSSIRNHSIMNQRIGIRYQNPFNRMKMGSKRFNSSKSTNSGANGANGSSEPKKPSGIKGLMQQYGYSALGVYLGLSFLDFPLCYLLVESQGEEKIREFQNKVLSYIGMGKKKEESEQEESSNKGAEQEESHSTLWTKIAFAYAFHKSLIFVRLPVTAAITPFVVSKLRKMGFNVGTAAASAVATVAQKAKSTVKGKTDGVPPLNPKFGKPASKGQRWFF